MTKIGSFLFFLLLQIFSAISVAANGTIVQAQVDRNEMSLGDTFTMTVAVISSDEVDIQEPRVPDLDGFDLLNSWQSTAISQKLVNTPSGMQFETQRRKEFHFLLSPKREGTLSLSSFEIVVGEKVHRTQPIVIRVQKLGTGGTSKRSPYPKSQQEDPFEAMDRAEEELFGQLLKQRQRMLQQVPGGFPNYPAPGVGRELPNAAFRSLPTNPNEAFFVSVEVDKTEVVEGEQVTASWYIYTRGGLETLDRQKFPSLRGFWKEIIEEVPAIQFSEELVNGIPWKKALLASHALFPIKPGTAVIDEYRIKSRVRLPSQNLGGFYGQAYEFTKASARVEVKVKPLPVEGRPSDFTGAVGQFEVQASADNPQVPVNQPLSIKVRFEGAGNAKVIELPAIQWPPTLEQYDTKSQSKFFKNGRSFKEFEILVIPRQQGEVEIPSFGVSMFDPAAKKYYSRTTQALKIKVVDNPNAPVGASSRIGDKSQKREQLGSELALPEPILVWESYQGQQYYRQPWAWFLAYGAIIISLLLKARVEFGWGRRRRSLKELVQRRFKIVEAALAKNDYRKVGGEMTNIFYTILGDVAGTGGASIELTRLLEKVPPSLRRDHGDSITRIFEFFQTLSFAPDEMLGNLKEFGAMRSHFDQAKKVLSAVMESLDEKSSD